MPTWLIVFIVVVPVVVFLILVIPPAKPSNRTDSSEFQKNHPEWFRSPVRHYKKSYGSDPQREDFMERCRDALYTRRYGTSAPIGIAAGLAAASHQGFDRSMVSDGLAAGNFDRASPDCLFDPNNSMIPEKLYQAPTEDFVGRTMPGVEPEVLFEPQYSMIEGNIYHDSFEPHGFS